MIQEKVAKKPYSIAIVICYFGKFPWYFDFFVHSCRYNPSIDFIVISDNNEYDVSVPSNLRLVHMTFNEVRQIAQLRIDKDVRIKYPYKLCDFKPTFGVLFYEFIKQYDFWGYGDIDVIYGDLRNFITDSVLDNHDVISLRHDFLTGYFQLFKNTQNMRLLFTKSKDFLKVFTSDEHFCFDETNFQHHAFTKGTAIRDMKHEVDSMMHVIRQLQDEKQIRCYFDFHVAEGVPGSLRWDKGKLYYKDRFEVALYHLIKFKSVYKPINRINTTAVETFRISSSRILGIK